MNRRTFLKLAAAAPLLPAGPLEAATGSALLSTARIYIDWGDAAALGGFAVRNRNDPRRPSRNLVCFPSGPILNESGSPWPERIHYSAAGPSGGSDAATRVVTSAPHQALFLYRSATCPAIPKGPYGLRVRLRSTPGTGRHPVAFGLSTQLAAGTIQDVEWRSRATVFSTEFSYPGVGDISLHFPNAGTDVLVDQIQLYPGGLRAIPPWGTEALAGARRAFAFKGSIGVDAQRNWILREGEAGAWIYEPDLAAHTYSGVSIMHVGALDALSDGALAVGVSLPTDSTLGTVRDTTLSIGWEGASPFAGEERMRPAKSFRSHSGINLLGRGLHVTGQVLTAEEARMYFWEAPVYTERGIFPLPFRANRWMVGSGANVPRAWLPFAQAYGRHAATLIWDRALSQGEWAAAVAAVREAYSDRGLGVFDELHLFSGDSNATRATGDWTQLITSAGYLAPSADVWAANTSVGGQTTASLEGPTGRFAAIDRPILAAAATARARAIYHYLMGTNDWRIVNEGVPRYVARVQSLIEQALAVDPLVSVMYHTILPRTDEQSGATPFEANRRAANEMMRAWIAEQDPSRVVLCDFGRNETVGDPAQNDRYRLTDGIHLNRSGDAAAAAICAAAIVRWRELVRS